MTTDPTGPLPYVLRQAVAADLRPVSRLASPLARSLCLAPLAAVLVVAAPVTFSVRDLAALGWFWSWGASIAQVGLGLALVAAALREAVPGRAWSRPALVMWLIATMGSVTTIALVSWERSPSELMGSRVIVGAVCAVYALASALPPTLFASLLAVGAWPTRPAVSGWLAGLGGGLMADAGWRLFCHFSEPHHVLIAHLGGVIAAGVVGAVVTSRIAHSHR